MYRDGMSYRNDLHYELETALRNEASKRTTKSTEAWILDERQTMLDAVNRERSRRGKTSLALTDVERVERQAVGHSDYAHKFALYCVELVDA
jgi:hypothetical protein